MVAAAMTPMRTAPPVSCVPCSVPDESPHGCLVIFLSPVPVGRLPATAVACLIDGI